MAKLQQRRTQNTEGDFYVDTSCIDCDAAVYQLDGEIDRFWLVTRLTSISSDALKLCLMRSGRIGFKSLDLSSNDFSWRVSTCLTLDFYAHQSQVT